MTDGQVIATAHVSAREAGAGRALVDALGPGPFSCIMVFASPEADLDALLSEQGFGAPVIGCTTAGEIAPRRWRRFRESSISTANVVTVS